MLAAQPLLVVPAMRKKGSIRVSLGSRLKLGLRAEGSCDFKLAAFQAFPYKTDTHASQSSHILSTHVCLLVYDDIHSSLKIQKYPPNE